MTAISILFGTLSNFVNPNRISWIEAYKDVEDIGGIVNNTEVDTTILDQNPPLPNFDPDHIKIYNIDLDRAHRLFVSKKAIFIDARYPDDYITEHIPGSINLPNDMFDDFYPEVAHLFRIDDPLVIYCSGSGCDLSVLLADNLRYMGYEKLMLFEEGQPAWIAAGYPIKEGQ